MQVTIKEVNLHHYDIALDALKVAARNCEEQAKNTSNLNSVNEVYYDVFHKLNYFISQMRIARNQFMLEEVLTEGSK
jgi:hypothetical protein